MAPAQNRLSLPKSLPWGSLFALDDPITGINTGALCYSGASRSWLIHSSILVSIFLVTNALNRANYPTRIRERRTEESSPFYTVPGKVHIS